MAIEQRGFFSVHHLLYHESSVYNGHLQGPGTDTHTYCRAFGSRAVTACFNDLGLSRLGFDHPTFRLRRELNNPLRHRRGLMNEMRSWWIRTLILFASFRPIGVNNMLKIKEQIFYNIHLHFNVHDMSICSSCVRFHAHNSTPNKMFRI